jgi:Dyp-type peroxidase family
VFLTAKGYQRLGFSLEKLQDAFSGAENYFLAGMKSKKSLAALNDPDPQTWEKEYQKEIHAMILLANQRVTPLKEKEDEIREELDEFADVLVTEYGVVQHKANQKVEHFGFIDAMSDPIFFLADLPTNTNNWDPSAPLSLVLVPDTLAQEKDCYGSYLVFRKLQQDVERFHLGKPRLAEELAKSGTPVDPEYVGAMMIGRFAREGTPLTLSGQDNRPQENNFIYAHDSGLKCPVFAHIRATNPRSDKTKRIARRSIPYGRRISMDRLPDGPVGLLFMCFQRSVDNQFAHIQKQANQDHDPLIRQPPDDPLPEVQWPTQWGKGTTLYRLDPTWVTLKGGEFFFAPSIPFLVDLKKP